MLRAVVVLALARAALPVGQTLANQFFPGPAPLSNRVRRARVVPCNSLFEEKLQEKRRDRGKRSGRSRARPQARAPQAPGPAGGVHGDDLRVPVLPARAGERHAGGPEARGPEHERDQGERCPLANVAKLAR